MIIQATAHLGHLRLHRETGTSRGLIVGALVGTSGVAALELLRHARSAPGTLVLLVALLVGAALLEHTMRRRGRAVEPRVRR